MRTNQALSKIMALALSITMMFTAMPLTVAAEDGMPLGVSGEIIAFAPLDEGVAAQTVLLGTFLEDLNLPDSLMATVEFPAEEIAEDTFSETQTTPVIMDIFVPVTWAEEPTYDCGTVGEYIFSASVGDGYTLAATPPAITVTVTAGAAPLAVNFIAPFAVTTYELGNTDNVGNKQYLWSNVSALVAALGDGDTISITDAPGSTGVINLGAKDNITIIGMGNTDLSLSIITSAANLKLQNITMTASNGPAIEFVGMAPNTLTVEGAVNITGTGQAGSGISSLNRLAIKGSGSLNATGGSDAPGIYASNNLTISARTTATGGDSSGITGGYGILSGGDITINKSAGEVKATGGNATGGTENGGDGIYAFNDMSISAKLTAEGGSSVGGSGGFGINVNDNITISGETTAKGGDGGIGGYGIFASVGDITISGATTATGGIGIGNSSYPGDPLGNGGPGILAYSGDVSISARTTATGGNGNTYGGYGIEAYNNIFIFAQTTATGGNGAAEAGGTGICAIGSIIISAKTAAAGGSGSSVGGDGIVAFSSIDISGETTATGSTGSIGGNGILAIVGNIAITAKTKATGGNGDEGGSGIALVSGKLKISGVVTATGGGSASPSYIAPSGNAILIYDDIQSVIMEETGAGAAKLILKDGANATKTDGVKTDPNLNLTMDSALAGKAQWAISPVSAIIGGVKDTKVAVLTTASTIEIYLSELQKDNGKTGGRTGGGGGGGAALQQTIRESSNAVKMDYSQSGGTVTLTLPDSKINEIIDKSMNTAVFDLSGATNATSAALPKTALTKLANAGLHTEIKLPTGTVTFNREAAASIAAQASGANISIEIKPVDESTLNSEQVAAINAGDMVIDINIHSEAQNIYSFDGELTVAIPYRGELPVAVWYLNDAGELEKLDCAYNAETKTVSFALSHLSLYVIGTVQDTSAPEWVNPFTDVRESDWFFNSVKYVHQNNLFSGTSTAAFSPNGTMTRGMMVNVLWRLAGSPTADSTEFADVEQGSWYTAAINWAVANDVMTGIGDNKFAPNSNITREQMAVVLHNYASVEGILLPEKLTGDFDDSADISSWAKEAAEAMYAADILSGNGANHFNPKGNATRAEVASMFMNFAETTK